MNRYQEYFDNPPKPLTDMRLVMIEIEGEKRRKAYIKKHPREKSDPAPAGWEEPLEPKKRRRRK